ncbi:hypothetical protein GCM10027168_26390 [Streptomyces capparidis]
MDGAVDAEPASPVARQLAAAVDNLTARSARSALPVTADVRGTPLTCRL